MRERERTPNRMSTPMRSSTIVGNRSTVIIGNGLGPIPDEYVHISELKAMLHGAIFLATCNAILLLRDVN